MSATGAERPLRIGIFGGTFDPVHVGHLVAAVNVRHELALDRLLLVVSNLPWQKAGARPVSPAEERYAVVAAAVKGCEGLEASRVEIDRGGDSYTADTVADVEVAYPGAELYLVIGADVAYQLDTWERVEELHDRVRLVIVNRPGSKEVTLGDTGELARFRASVVEVPALEISSTDLRHRAATGRPLDFLIPSEAIREMRRRSLYVGSA